jgi:hypothetical protein
MSRPSHIRMSSVWMSYSVLFTALLIVLLLAFVLLFPPPAR